MNPLPLSPFEMEMLIRVCSMKWTAEDRRYIAKMIPTVYAKLTDTVVTVVAEGAKVSLDIDHAAPKAPAPNLNKGAAWE
jgi:hypothetical protein